jgi:hypothetical protein
MVGKNNVIGGRSGLGGSIHRIAEGYAAPTFVGASDCPGWKRSILHPDDYFGRDTLGCILSAVKAYFNLLNIELKSELDILDQIKEVKEKIEKPIREINRMK